MSSVASLPDREIQIAKRLREARMRLLISQTLFATKVEISQARLAKYELGLVPLPWSVGDLISMIFRINPIWLGNGDGDPWEPRDHVDDRLPAALGARPLFSQVVDEVLLPIAKNRPFSGKVAQAAQNIGASAPKVAIQKSVRKHAAKPTGPFLSPTQIHHWDPLAYGTLRLIISRIKDDDIVDFSEEVDLAIREIGSRFSKRKTSR